MKHLNGAEFLLILILTGLMAWFVYNHSEVAFKQKVYPAARALAAGKMDYDTRNLKTRDTEHFRIKYEAQDEELIPLIAQTAEESYASILKLWQQDLPAPITVVVYADRAKMAKGLNWSGGESAMGAYYGGLIQVLSPKAWLAPDHYQDFATKGPLAHELTHLMLDYAVHGNYPRWYTEGLAQYSEYRINGYEWKTATNGLNQSLYSMPELDQSFDELSNQALAYREAFAAVRYLAAAYGDEGLGQIQDQLSSGKTLAQAIEALTGEPYADFVQDWQKWAQKNL